MPACLVSNKAQDCSHQAVLKLLQDILLTVPSGEAEDCAGPTAQQHLPEAAPCRHPSDGPVPVPTWWTNGPKDAQTLHNVALAKSRNDSNQSETSVATAECVRCVGLRIVRNCRIELLHEATGSSSAGIIPLPHPSLHVSQVAGTSRPLQGINDELDWLLSSLVVDSHTQRSTMPS